MRLFNVNQSKQNMTETTLSQEIFVEIVFWKSIESIDLNSIIHKTGTDESMYVYILSPFSQL